MITEKDTIKCEAIFSDDKRHRLLWKRVWDKDNPLACVVMLNPCLADTLVTDTTSAIVVNNIACMSEFGGVSEFVRITPEGWKVSPKHTQKFLSSPIALPQITPAAGSRSLPQLMKPYVTMSRQARSHGNVVVGKMSPRTPIVAFKSWGYSSFT